MWSGKDGRAQQWPRWRRRHAAFSAAAVASSLILHYAAVTLFPALPIGVPDNLPRSREHQSIRLHRVDPRPPPVRKPVRSSAARPGPDALSPAPDAEAFSRALTPAAPGTLDGSRIPFSGANNATADPVLSEPFNVWEPRQEILRIHDTLVPDAAAALPRRIVPEVPRAVRAPDVSLPVSLSRGEWEDLIGRSSPSGAAVTGGAPAMASIAAPPSPSAPEENVREAVREPSRAFDEKRDDVTDIEAMEPVLALDVSAYRPAGDPHVYFALQIQPDRERILPPLSKDMLLIQDCSASMTQRKLDQCKKGLKAFIGRLAPNDRYNIMGFDEDAQFCFETWAENNAVHRARAEWFIESLEARGQTDVLTSLNRLAAWPRHPGRPMIAVWITDGRPTAGVIDSSAIIEAFTEKNAGAVSTFAVGGGLRVNRFLLDLLTYKNRGDVMVVRNLHDLPEALDDTARQLSRPLLYDMHYRISGVSEEDVYPRKLTPFFQDRPLVLYGRAPADSERAAIRIAGYTGGVEKDMVFELRWNEARPGSGEIARQWAWQKMYHLIGEHIRTADPSLVRAMNALAGRHGLSVPYESELNR